MLLNPVVFKLTLRATLGRKRALIFMIAPILLLAITVLLKLEAHSPVWPPEFLGIFGYTVVVPLTALIIGTSVLGAEIDDSSVISLLATPMRRSTVVLTKFVVATLADAAVRRSGRVPGRRRSRPGPAASSRSGCWPGRPWPAWSTTPCS